MAKEKFKCAWAVCADLLLILIFWSYILAIQMILDMHNSYMGGAYIYICNSVM